jgi:hypothetical protein
MINNTLYRKGQKITAGESKVTFTVEEIRPDGVSVTTPAVDTVSEIRAEDEAVVPWHRAAERNDPSLTNGEPLMFGRKSTTPKPPPPQRRREA